MLEIVKIKNIKLIIILIIFFQGHLTFGQSYKNNISLNYGIGINQIYLNGFDKKEGFKNDGTFIIGLNYQKKISKIVYLKTGLDYIRSNVYVNKGYHPYWADSYGSWDINLLSFPVTINYTFLDYFFIESGIITDLQFNIWDCQPLETQSGFGITAGFGAIYHYKHFSLTLNSFMNYHSIIQFFPYDRERLCEMGIKMELAYSF